MIVLICLEVILRLFFTFVNRLANLTVIADKLPKLAFLSFDLEVPSLDGEFG